jgi:hypothetical protein
VPAPAATDLALQLWQLATVVRRDLRLGARFRARVAGMAIDVALAAAGREPIGQRPGRIGRNEAAAVLTETLKALQDRGADWDDLMAAASRFRLQERQERNP